MNISIYITSFNQQAYLREALDSVLAQTRPADEILVVDDASSDGSPEMIRSYASQHPRLIKPIFHARNTGVSQARRDAVAAATGDYIAGVDGDDRLLPRKLEYEAAALEASGADLAYSNYYTINGAGARQELWNTRSTGPEGQILAETFGRHFPRRNLFRSELIRLKTVHAAGGYDPSFRIFEDFDLRIRMAACGKATYVAEPLCEYRLHPAGLSAARAGEKFDVLQRIYQKNVGLLESLDQTHRRRAKQGFQSWAALFAHAAAVAWLNTAGAGPLKRRAIAFKLFGFCARHNPDLLRVSDIGSVLLPARALQAWRNQGG